MRALVLMIALACAFCRAQDVPGSSAGSEQTDQQHLHEDAGIAGMEMQGMEMTHGTPKWMPSQHESSGTSWQPAATAGHLWMRSWGGWDVMAHGVVFLDYNQQGGPRGAGKAESLNWVMLMEQHDSGGGSILFREMFSAESLTAPHPGFPELFQTGETYHGRPLVDHQHPHNVFAELAMAYTRPIGEKVRWLFYGGPVGEPALGPVTYLHRASAAELPMAPLSHHLQDSTHTSFGVVTTGLVVARLKVEGSLFNGREPNEKRYTLQLAALDSWSARVSVAPSRNWTAQYSYGRLERPEALEVGSERRQTASAEYVRPMTGGSWATSVVWGRKFKVADSRRLNSYLAESTLNFRAKNYAFTRLELVDKDELFPGSSPAQGFRVGAYSAGGARDLIHNGLWQLALGADVTWYTKPAALNSAYGSNPVSFQIFLRARPGLNHHPH
jgi:hypothetical protein